MVVCAFYQQGRCKFGGMIWRPPTLLSPGARALTSPSRPLVLQIVASMNTLASPILAPVIALERCRGVVLQVCLLVFCNPQVAFAATEAFSGLSNDCLPFISNPLSYTPLLCSILVILDSLSFTSLPLTRFCGSYPNCLWSYV